jgi:hypothetical protein
MHSKLDTARAGRSIATSAVEEFKLQGRQSALDNRLSNASPTRTHRAQKPCGAMSVGFDTSWFWGPGNR